MARACGYGLQWGIAFLLTALCEESLLRAYLQFTLVLGVGFWWAAVLRSLAKDPDWVLAD